jgi:hypothetical protein
MWTENVAWFSNEEGKKGRIEVGRLADLMVPDRDYFACAENEIADITSSLTIVGGNIVYGAGAFAEFDAPLPPAMPSWSPVRTFRGYGAWGDTPGAEPSRSRHVVAQARASAHACHVHGHDHAAAWSSRLPIADLKAFWGALGCACFAF